MSNTNTWKIVFAAPNMTFNIVECPDCHNQALCGTVVDYIFCPYCGSRRIVDDREDKAVDNIRNELARIERMTVVIDSLRYKLAKEGFDEHK